MQEPTRPSFPWRRAVPKAAAAAGPADKVTLNFYLPHSIEFKAEKARAGNFRACKAGPAGSRAAASQVDMVSIPATSGEFGVLPNHVATVAQLKPGVLAVHKEMDKDVKKARSGDAPLRSCACCASDRALGGRAAAARRAPSA